LSTAAYIHLTRKTHQADEHQRPFVGDCAVV